MLDFRARPIFARSSSSSSPSQLSTQLVSLLSDILEKVKDAIKVLPVGKKCTALEEVMCEYDSVEQLERELPMQ
ncbi:hypothetical protein AZE42_03737 [Rhizopogon vesiculosus]|uniref:Uncharacterized protein n=1 Tax=Rhizopogon vesiculosus TaxID=180088 RepID=A0A1J8QEJ9_9AGAM|nr:hypothetical protein AZE42_03737 [Rhizopogon vesiculosus]